MSIDYDEIQADEMTSTGEETPSPRVPNRRLIQVDELTSSLMRPNKTDVAETFD